MEKKVITQSAKQLRLENENLLSRLTEAEETLEAIRNGEVDAIIVSGKDGEHVFSLTSAETPYRIIVEEMNEGAVSLSADGSILYSNIRFAELVSIPPEQITGSNFTRFISESDMSKFHLLLKAALKEKCVGVFTYLSQDSSPRYYQLSFSPLPASEFGDICIIISDVTEFKEIEKQLQNSYKTLELKVTERTAELNESIGQLADSRISVMNVMEDVLETNKILEFTNEKLKKEIDERILMSKALQKSEERFKVVAESAGEWIWEINAEGLYTYSSPLVEKILGYKPEEIVGKKHFYDFYQEDVKEQLKEGSFKAFDQKLIIKDFENPNTHKDGHIVILNTTGSPILDDEENLIGFHGADSDITDRKRAEQIQKVLYNISNAAITSDNLEKLISLIQEDLGTIIDTTNFYLALYNEKTHALSLPFHTDQKDKFTSFPAGKSLTAYVIKTKKSLLATRDVKNKLVQSGEIELLGADSEVWLGVPLFVKGKVTGAFAVQSYDDKHAFNKSDMEMLEFISGQISISIDRKKAEQDLIKALEKAEESDRLKSAFLANMSHEIRTPMNGILGFADLLKEPCLTGEEQKKYIGIIEKSGDRMLNIINDIIDISRIESGLVEISISETNINDQLEYLYTFFKPEAEKKGISLSIRNGLSPEEVIIRTDSQKLQAILINLVKNAIKYTKEGSIEFGCRVLAETHGRASLQPKSGRASQQNTGRASQQPKTGDASLLQFYVKDTGIGISKERQEAIFERFIQADIEDKQAYQGAGLGLSISKSYVELLGGNIRVESEVGRGSTFFFSIPLNTQPAVQAVTDDPDPGNEMHNQINPEVSGLKTLIVEDDEDSAMFLSEIVELYCKEVIIVGTGIAAVEACRKNPDIDLVLMDIRMHEMDGYEATRQIRQFNKDVIIIAQTAFALAGDREKAMEAGCNDYISKPIKKRALMRVIEKYFQKQENK